MSVDLYHRSKVTDAPATKPITLAELKAHLNLDASFTADDTLLETYIDAATELAQNFTGRKFVDQEITMFLDRWPVSGTYKQFWHGTVQGSITELTGANDSIELPWPPVSSITSISEFDESNTETTYDSSNYYLDNSDDDMFARVVFNTGAQFSTALRSRNSIKIVFRTGYATQPGDIKVGVSMIAAYLYSNRGDCNDCGCVAASGGSSFLTQRIIYSVL